MGEGLLRNTRVVLVVLVLYYFTEEKRKERTLARQVLYLFVLQAVKRRRLRGGGARGRGRASRLRLAAVTKWQAVRTASVVVRA